MEHGIRLLTDAQIEALRWQALRIGAKETSFACWRELHRRWVHSRKLNPTDQAAWELYCDSTLNGKAKDFWAELTIQEQSYWRHRVKNDQREIGGFIQA